MKNIILKLVDEQENLEPQHGADREVINLRSVQRNIIDDRRQARREGSSDRRSDDDLQPDCADSIYQKQRQLNRPVINREEQLARLCGMQDCYYAVRVTRARCQPAIKLLDVIFSFADAPSLPLKDCRESCTCQYQGVRNRRCGLRRLGLSDRRKNVREDEPVRRAGQGRRKSDSGFVFFTTNK
jgi:hypothetical protein